MAPPEKRHGKEIATSSGKKKKKSAFNSSRLRLKFSELSSRRQKKILRTEEASASVSERKKKKKKRKKDSMAEAEINLQDEHNEADLGLGDEDLTVTRLNSASPVPSMSPVRSDSPSHSPVKSVSPVKSPDEDLPVETDLASVHVVSLSASSDEEILEESSETDSSTPPSLDEDQSLDNSDLTISAFPEELLNRCIANRQKQKRTDLQNPSARTPASVPYSSAFISAEASERYHCITSREFIDMRSLVLGSPTSRGAENMLQESGLLSSAVYVGKYVKEVVYEFYANFLDRITEAQDRHYVYVRGQMFEFSPALINSVLGLPHVKYFKKRPLVPVPGKAETEELVQLITEGRIKKWSSLATRHFAPDMTVLYKVVCYNWLPTTNSSALRMDRVMLLSMVKKRVPFNLGKVIFDQIVSASKLCGSASNKLRPMYPNLIYMVLQFQRPVLLSASDKMSPAPMPLLKANRTYEKPAAEALPVSQRVADLTHIMELIKQHIQRELRGEYGQTSATTEEAAEDDQEMDDEE